MMITRSRLILSAILLAAASVGLEAGSVDPAFQAKPALKVHQISIDKASFGDAPAGIKVGDTIEWVNTDIFDHTVTAKNGSFDVVIPAGKKARVVMKKLGTFDYFCKFHPNMTGSITVKK